MRARDPSGGKKKNARRQSSLFVRRDREGFHRSLVNAEGFETAANNRPRPADFDEIPPRDSDVIR